MPLETGPTVFETVSWTNLVKNEAVLHRVKEDDILHTIKLMKAKSVGHTLRRKCLIKHVIAGEIKGVGRRGRRRKQLIFYLQETRRY